MCIPQPLAETKEQTALRALLLKIPLKETIMTRIAVKPPVTILGGGRHTPTTTKPEI
jgi:hypothetical protein